MTTKSQQFVEIHDLSAIAQMIKDRAYRLTLCAAENREYAELERKVDRKTLDDKSIRKQDKAWEKATEEYEKYSKDIVSDSSKINELLYGDLARQQYLQPETRANMKPLAADQFGYNSLSTPGGFINEATAIQQMATLLAQDCNALKVIDKPGAKHLEKIRAYAHDIASKHCAKILAIQMPESRQVYLPFIPLSYDADFYVAGENVEQIGLLIKTEAAKSREVCTIEKDKPGAKKKDIEKRHGHLGSLVGYADEIITLGRSVKELTGYQTSEQTKTRPQMVFDAEKLRNRDITYLALYVQMMGEHIACSSAKYEMRAELKEKEAKQLHQKAAKKEEGKREDKCEKLRHLGEKITKVGINIERKLGSHLLSWFIDVPHGKTGTKTL